MTDNGSNSGSGLKINWSAVGPTIQALLIAGGMVAGFSVAVSEQRSFAAVTTTNIAQLNAKVDKLYDLLIYPHVAQLP